MWYGKLGLSFSSCDLKLSGKTGRHLVSRYTRSDTMKDEYIRIVSNYAQCIQVK